MAKAKKAEKKSLAEVLKGLESKYGQGAVISGDKMEPVDGAISTGSLGLDIALGIGGIAHSPNGNNGKIYEIIGWESTGKSTLTQTIIGNAQKQGLKCLLLDGENSIDEVYSPKLGINMEELLVVQLDETAGEGAYDKMQALVETGEIDLVVIDSYNSLQPKKIVDDGTDAANMGLHARMMGKVVMKCNNFCKAYGTTFIFIGQYRQAIGVMYGPTEVGQANNSLKFYAHVRMETSRSTTKDNSVMDGEDRLGNLHKVKVMKNKLAAPFKKAEYNIIYGVGIDRYTEVMELAHEYEVAKKRGESFTYNAVKYNVEEFLELLKSNDDLFEELRAEILKEAKVKNLNSFEDPNKGMEIIEAITEKMIADEG